MLDHDLLIRTALENGATKAMIIPQEKVITNRAFWDICAGNGCGNFSQCWNCPPAIGEIDDLMAKIRTYTHGVLYQTIWEIEDSFDFEGMGEAGSQHQATSRRIQKAIKNVLGEGFLHLSSGGCDLCERCAKKDNEPCRFPEKLLPPMEGYGIDVYRTAKGTELKYINGENTVTYFGLVLFTEAENG